MERTKPRRVRVFVSSTFRDMQAEREELVKRVFPRIRKLCQDRDVAFHEVDLRWGVTPEEAEQGAVLPVCLDEIENCRPYFLGILGERYGHVPPRDSISDATLEKHPWIAEHEGASLTELEFFHGALSDPDSAKHAYIYLRSPRFLESLPPKQRTEAREPSAHSRERLQKLKNRVRNSAVHVRDHYESPHQFGDLVLADLTAAIERDFPAERSLGPFAREHSRQEAFARTRSELYVGHQSDLTRLDEHAGRDTANALVVHGESGAGKSALLASWAKRYRDRHPEAAVLTHFIGATPASESWSSMLRRIMAWLDPFLAEPSEIPWNDQDLRPAFAQLLTRAGRESSRRIVLVLDGLNQLEDRGGARDLTWLPAEIPRNVQMVLSTLPGRSDAVLQQRNWPRLEVTGLTGRDRRELIAHHLAQYTKKLEASQIDRIANSPQCRNALYLRTLLEELRVFGSFEGLDDRIGHYLKTDSPAALFECILERFEEDYERDRPQLVRDTFSAIAAARRGLAEGELLELLGRDGRPLPQAHFSPLRLASADSLLELSGLLQFGHEFLREAVRRRYLADPNRLHAVRSRVAAHFLQQPDTDRALDELPWLLSKTEQWDHLATLLADPVRFDRLCRRNESEVLESWSKIERATNRSAAAAYEFLAESASFDPTTVYRAALLLSRLGHTKTALRLRQALVKHYEDSGTPSDLAIAKDNLALSLHEAGEFEQAFEVGEQAVSLLRTTEQWRALASSLGHLGLIQLKLGRSEQALQSHREAQEIAEQRGDRRNLMAALSNQAAILSGRGELDRALERFRQVEVLCREADDGLGVAHSLGNQALTLFKMGQLTEAEQLHEQEESQLRRMGHREALATCLCNRARMRQDEGRSVEAEQLLREAEEIAVEIDNPQLLMATLDGKAGALLNEGRLDEAMQIYRRIESASRRSSYERGVLSAIGNIGNVRFLRGQVQEALQNFEEAQTLAERIQDSAMLASSLGMQGRSRLRLGDAQRGLDLLIRSVELTRTIGELPTLATNLDLLVTLYAESGELERCLEASAELQKALEEMQEWSKLAEALEERGGILRRVQRLEGSVSVLEHCVAICRREQLESSLQSSLGSLAISLRWSDRYQQALATSREHEQVSRDCGDTETAALARAYQADILADMGRNEEAVECARSALEFAESNGLTHLVPDIQEVLSRLL